MAHMRIPELPQCSAAELADAVRRTIHAQAEQIAPQGDDAPQSGPPGRQRLHQAAAQLSRPEPNAPGAAEAAAYITALIEVAYLVAAADGLDEIERSALATLVSETVGPAVNAEAVQVLFDDFGRKREEQGEAARLEAVSAHFRERHEREEAMSFGVLVAMSDRVLASAEQDTLIALGKHFEFKRGVTLLIAHQVAGALERALAANSDLTS